MVFGCCRSNDAVTESDGGLQGASTVSAFNRLFSTSGSNNNHNQTDDNPKQNDDNDVGYDCDFMGIHVPLPTFDDDTLAPHVLRKSGFDQGDGAWRRYIHYSVATNRERRQPICVALNIDQARLKTGTGRGAWREDDQVGREYQLNNDYYQNNDWDRGHLANRSSAAWGDTFQEAQRAADDTMVYTNACLQHANLNQDEWLQVENWVKTLEEDANDKISVFSGPLYSRRASSSSATQFLQPPGRPAAEIPAGFFKIVVFVDREQHQQLATRAFVYLQNAAALQDKQGSRRKNHTAYQVATREVEQQTGLIFDQVLHSSNPIQADGNGGGPVVVVTGPEEIVHNDNDNNNNGSDHPDVPSQVFIAAALINPEGDERAGEWVSIANYSAQELDLTGWTLSDSHRQPMSLSDTLAPGETLKLNPLQTEDGGKLLLANNGGNLTLRNPDGFIVDRVQWKKVASGRVTIFDPF